MRPAALLRALVALLLSVQLLATLHHQHPIDQTPSDCPACTLSMHWSGGATPPSVLILALAPAFPFTATWTHVPVPRAPRAHVIPFSQAPPAQV
jgi:hypothetical protein